MALFNFFQKKKEEQHYEKMPTRPVAEIKPLTKEQSERIAADNAVFKKECTALNERRIEPDGTSQEVNMKGVQKTPDRELNRKGKDEYQFQRVHGAFPTLPEPKVQKEESRAPPTPEAKVEQTHMAQPEVQTPSAIDRLKEKQQAPGREITEKDQKSAERTLNAMKSAETSREARQQQKTIDPKEQSGKDGREQG